MIVLADAVEDNATRMKLPGNHERRAKSKPCAVKPPTSSEGVATETPQTARLPVGCGSTGAPCHASSHPAVNFDGSARSRPGSSPCEPAAAYTTRRRPAQVVFIASHLR
jgi:hypothetical protein